MAYLIGLRYVSHWDIFLPGQNHTPYCLKVGESSLPGKSETFGTEEVQWDVDMVGAAALPTVAAPGRTIPGTL